MNIQSFSSGHRKQQSLAAPLLRSSCAVAVLFLFTIPLAAENLQRIIPVSSTLYDDLSALYSAAGMVVPSQARPYTAEQFRMYLDAVPTRIRSALRAVYERVLEGTEQEKPVYAEDDFTVLISGSSSLLAYRHDLLGGDPREEGTYTWLFGYEERSPLISVPFEVWAFDSLYAEVEFSLKQDYRTIDDRLSPPGKEARLSDSSWTNLSTNIVSYDIFSPFRAFLAGGGKHWTLQFGRDRLSWGSGRTGNLMISDYPDFYDLLRFSAYWKGFTFTSVYTVFDPDTAHDETYLAMTAHRLEFNLWNRAVISLCEAVSFGKDTYPELVSDLNPMMLYHSWFIPERANSLMTAEVDAAVMPHVRAYGQVAMDEFVTATEQEAGATAKVRALGFIAGTEASLPLPGGLLFLRGEWARTDPWLYNRIAYPYFRSQRRVWSYADPAIDLFIVKPTGYRYGPDSIVAYLGAEYRAAHNYTLGLDFTLLTQGEKNLTSPYKPDAADTTPTGTPERRSILHAFAGWKALSWLSLGADGFLNFIESDGHEEGVNRTDSELALTITFSW